MRSKLNDLKQSLGENFLYEMYVERNLSSLEISKIVNIAKSNILIWLKKENIPVRTGSEINKKISEKMSGIRNIEFKKSLSYNFPQIASQWHPTLNKFKPTDVSGGTTKKVWWTCDKGHEWKAFVNNRAFKKTNCPYCSNKKINKDNCFLTTHPEMAKQWHPTFNELKPTDIVKGSNKKVWWLCDKGHSWRNKLVERNIVDYCPVCIKKNRKQPSPIKKTLSVTHPKLSKQWHPTLNSLKPDDVTSGSMNKVWWICDKGHEWKASVSNRRKTGCPKCSLNGFSKLEVNFLKELTEKLSIDACYECTKRKRIGKFIPDFVHKNLVIEIYGDYWHMHESRNLKYNPTTKRSQSEQAKYDKERISFIESEGYEVLVVWENEIINNFEKSMNRAIDFLKH